MKRRFLASLLAVAMLATMFAGFTAWADTAEPVRTYFDINFNNWASGNAWYNADKTEVYNTLGESNTFPWDFNSNGASISQSVVTDSFLGSKVWQLNRKADSTERVKIRFNIDDGTFPSNIFWTEFSVKYEGAFARMSFEHNNAQSTLFIDNNGVLRSRLYNSWGTNANWQSATRMGDETLELGKWYHIALAIDNTNSSRPMYLWVNGKKVVNGTVNSPAGSGLNYLDFNITNPSVDATISMDNFRLYTTAALDTHAEDSSLSDADATDGIGISGGYITGATEKTVTNVQAAFANGDKLVFVKDGKVLKEDNENVLGATAYAPLANGKGFRTYGIATEATQLITKTYLDANIDNWTSGFDTKTSDGTVLDSSNQYLWRNKSADQTVQSSAEKGGKVLKIANIPTVEKDDSFYTANRLFTGEEKYDKCKVLWTEFSVKYEGGFKRIGFGENNSGNSVLGINTEGTVIKFIPNSGYKYPGYFGEPVNAERLELGKWYHFVAALDFTDADAAEKGAPLYIWMNGELVENGGRTGIFNSTKAWKYHKFWVSKYGSEAASIYLDNFKVYETETVDTHAAKDFEISVEDVNPNDDIRIEDDYIVIPQDATVAAVKDAIKADNYVFMKDGAALSDDEPALGSIMTVNASNGIGFKQYEIVDLIIKDIIGPVGESAVTSFTASIPSAHGVHPVDAMINNGKYAKKDGDVYKSAGDVTDDLVVTIKLDAYYALQNVTIHERYTTDSKLKVTVDLGKNGRYTNVETNVPLTKGSTHLFSTPTVVSFAETEADTIRLTFSCAETATKDAQKYQIYEIEAEGYKSGDIPVYGKISGPIGESFVTSISTNIPSRVSSSPILGMIDDNREFHSNYGGTDASYYKSSELYDENPLKILFTFDGVYNISNIKVFERRADKYQNRVTVSVYAGINGNLTEIASDVALASGQSGSKPFEIPIYVPWTDADSVLLVFENAGSYTGAESNYQFSEIEVYGEKVGDVSSTAILPAYSFGELTNDKFIVSISNASDSDLEGVLLVAAYQRDELVGITTAKEISFGKGVTAEYTVNATGIIADGRTYKVFLWNNMDDAKPVLASKVITE